jgi:hypothetical protein
MKGLTIAAGVVVVLIVSAIALVVINADDTATASQTETTVPESGAPLPEMMDERLQDLVDRGLITQEQLDEMEGWFRGHGRWNGELPEGFDPEHFMGHGPRNGELPEGFDPEHFMGHGPWNGELPEGFDPEHFMGHGPWNGELPEGFDPEHFMGHGPWNGELPEGFDPEHFMGHGLGPHGFGLFGGDEDLTDLLGLRPEELLDALADGTPLTDIIDDPEAFVDSMVSFMEEGLNQAVEAGHLTQAEADQLIAEARSHAEAFVNGEGFHSEEFMGRRGPGGFHGFGDFGSPHGDDADAAAAGYSV